MLLKPGQVSILPAAAEVETVQQESAGRHQHHGAIPVEDVRHVYPASVLVACFTLTHGVHGEHERGSENRTYKRSQIHSIWKMCICYGVMLPESGSRFKLIESSPAPIRASPECERPR